MRRTRPLLRSSELVSLDGHNLTISQINRVAARAGSCDVALERAARERMNASVEAKRKLIASGKAIYGVTTGFGDSSGRQIPPAHAAALQRNLLRFLRVGTGPDTPDEIVRATMIIRANCAVRGHSGIRPEPIELLLELIRHDILPVIPERGSVGASGDLAPLSYVAATLLGEGRVRYREDVLPADKALRRCGLRSMRLESKEGLALVNGTSFMAAWAVLAFTKAQELTWAAELCTAVATEVRLGAREEFAAFPHVHKPHPGQMTSASHIYGLLHGSRLATSTYSSAQDQDIDGYVELERRIQAPYSIRCAPHVIGVLRDTLAWAEEWLLIEVNSSNDNPLFDASNTEVYNSGNFYGGHVAQAAQALAMAAASVADLLDRQLQLIVDDKYSEGLPHDLIMPDGAGPGEGGNHHGFKGAQIAASALTAEALHLTMPASSFSRSTESHNQDKVSMGSISSRHCKSIVDMAIEVAAIHMIALAQAVDLRDKRSLSPATRRWHDLVRQKVDLVDRDRPLDTDIQTIADIIKSGTFRERTDGPRA
jgi:phenylalanine ammonia-lyase